MDKQQIEELRSLADVITASIPAPAAEGRHADSSPADGSGALGPVARLAELARALADEHARGPQPAVVNVNVAEGLAPWVRFATRVVGAAGWFRATPEGTELHPHITRGIQELGLAIDGLENQR